MNQQTVVNFVTNVINNVNRVYVCGFCQEDHLEVTCKRLLKAYKQCENILSTKIEFLNRIWIRYSSAGDFTGFEKILRKLNKYSEGNKRKTK